MVLFINACVRGESRTKILADRFLKKINKPIDELRLENIDFPVVDEAFLQQRDRLIRNKDYGKPVFALARQFAEAEEIVIAAPFWDLSFPAALKQYLEQINIVGVTFYYTSDGVPKGLCKADKLTFITTAGGEFFPEEYGFGYIRALSQNFYGIRDVRQIAVTGLDLFGADTEEILRDACEEYGI